MFHFYFCILRRYKPASKRENPSKSNSFCLSNKINNGSHTVDIVTMLLESASIDWSVIYMRDIFSTPPIINGLSIVVLAIAQFIVRFMLIFMLKDLVLLKYLMFLFTLCSLV